MRGALARGALNIPTSCCQPSENLLQVLAAACVPSDACGARLLSGAGARRQAIGLNGVSQVYQSSNMFRYEG